MVLNRPVKLFELTILITKTFHLLMRPGGQNQPHSQSLNETLADVQNLHQWYLLVHQ